MTDGNGATRNGPEPRPGTPDGVQSRHQARQADAQERQADALERQADAQERIADEFEEHNGLMRRLIDRIMKGPGGL